MANSIYNCFDPDLENVTREQETSTGPYVGLLEVFFKEYLRLKAKSGRTFYNEIIKRTGWDDSNGAWMALSLAPLAEPKTSISGNPIDKVLIIKNFETGAVVRVEPRIVCHDLTLNPEKVLTCIKISTLKHGYAITIECVEQALELGWLDDEHAKFWLDLLRHASAIADSDMELKA